MDKSHDYGHGKYETLATAFIGMALLGVGFGILWNGEVDFYLPDTGVAIQVCYAMNLSDETFQREVQALVKLNKVFECRQLLIITYDDEERIELEKCAIEVIPVWKWLLGK